MMSDLIPFINPTFLHSIHLVLEFKDMMLNICQIIFLLSVHVQEQLPPPPYLNTLFILWRNRKVSAVEHKSNQSA